MEKEKELIKYIKEYLYSGMWQYEACYLGKADLELIIKALDQEPVLNKISTEIDEKISCYEHFNKFSSVAYGLKMAKEIVGKYKQEG